MFHSIFNFFDKLEDKVRGRLSRRPILYAFVGGFAIVMFWRGIWHGMDYFIQYYFHEFPWWDGPLSFLIGTCVLLISGIFVSTEIGNEVIISGLRGQKKIIEKTKEEIESEMLSFADIQKDLKELSLQLKNGQQKDKKRARSK